MRGELSADTEAVIVEQEINLPPADILILGAGSQLHDQIGWSLAEMGYRADVINITSLNSLKLPGVTDAIKNHYKAVVISGSDRSVNNGGPTIPTDLTDGSIPCLGICYGAQAMAKNNGGLVGKFESNGSHTGEYGRKDIIVDASSVAFSGLEKTTVLMSHGDSILKVPQDAHVIGKSENVVAAFEMHDGKTLALQFHPEAPETDEGKAILDRFLKDSAGLTPEADYNLEKAVEEYLEAEEQHIASMLLDGDEINGLLSGGVDSSVAAAMVAKVARELGRLDQVNFVYIDTGAMRVEDQMVIEELRELGVPVQKIEAKDRFFHSQVELLDENGKTFIAGPLTKTTDPDIKRRIAGKAFLDISDEIMSERRHTRNRRQRMLQGTNASDFVESGGHGGSRIKSHHNVSPETDEWRINGNFIEPMLGLFKHHVRMAARYYGLSENLASRQPFPGPGEIIRIVDNPTGTLEWPDESQIIQNSIDHVLRENTGNQFYAHYVPLTVSGSRGDEANNKHIAVIEGEATTAEDWLLLAKASEAITDNVHSISRVLFSPNKIIDRQAIHGATLSTNEEDVAALVELEEIKRQVIESVDIDPLLSQHFVASLGFDLDGNDNPVLALRCFITGSMVEKMSNRRASGGSETFLLGIAAIPGVHIPLPEFMVLIEALQQAAGDRTVVYDLTNKPPGTTEFQ